MKRKFKRLTALIVTVLFLIPLLCVSGCSKVVSDPVTEYLAYLKNGQYPRIYKLLTRSSITNLSLADMTDRYEAVIAGLGIQNLDGEILDRRQDKNGEWDVYLLMTYEFEKIGTLQLGNTLHLSVQDDVWAINWNDGMIFPGLSEGDRVSLITLKPTRGEIFDSTGKLLAKNTAAISVFVDLAKASDLDTTIRMLAPLVDMTEYDVRKAVAPETLKTDEESEEPEATPAPDSDEEDTTFSRTGDTGKGLKVVKAYAPDDFSDELRAALGNIPGVGLEEHTFTILREYPYGRLLSHQLGYVGYVTAEDLEKEENANLTTDAVIGKAGLEREYEMTLRGETGYELAIFNSNGEKTASLWKREAVDGADLHLTIDIELQQSAETLLMENLTDDMSGAVVVLDPEKGATLAQASGPSYDPNDFTRGITEETWALMQDPASRQPMYDRTTLGLYPPGSTFKPLTAGIGLETGAITTEFEFDQSGIVDNTWQPDDERWNYPPIRRVSRTPDPMNLLNAMTYSDNIYFAYTAMQAGEEAFRSYCTSFGIGQSFDSDLSVATSRISNTDVFTSIKVLADSGYGQGEILITPLQMASLFGAFSNGGRVMRPYIVDSTARMNGHSYETLTVTEPTANIEQILEPSTLETIRPMLRRVITNGTGRDLDISGLEVCGKTGTAQVGTDNEREIAWFIAYNTEGEKHRLVCVTLEVPANGGSARTQITKALLKQATAE